MWLQLGRVVFSFSWSILLCTFCLCQATEFAWISQIAPIWHRWKLSRPLKNFFYWRWSNVDENWVYWWIIRYDSFQLLGSYNAILPSGYDATLEYENVDCYRREQRNRKIYGLFTATHENRWNWTRIILYFGPARHQRTKGRTGCPFKLRTDMSF